VPAACFSANACHAKKVETQTAKHKSIRELHWGSVTHKFCGFAEWSERFQRYIPGM